MIRSPVCNERCPSGNACRYFKRNEYGDMDRIAEAIALVIKGGEDKIPEARAIVQTLTDKYPLI